MPVRQSQPALLPRSLSPWLCLAGGVALVLGCSGEPSPLFAQVSEGAGGAAASGGKGSATTSGGQAPVGNTGASGNQPASSGGRFSSMGGASNGTGGVTSTSGGTPSGSGGISSSSGGSAAGGAVSSGGGASVGGSTASGGSGGGSPLGGAGNLGGSGGSNTTGGQGSCIPHAEICDGVDNNCLAGTSDEVCPADCIGRSFEGKGYMFCSLRETWAEAVSLCQASASRTLVKVESSGENSFVLGVATELGWLGPWLGASDAKVEGDWRWLDDTKFWSGDQNGSSVGGRFSLWADGNPNNGEAGQDCAAMCVQANNLACNAPGVWNDVDCAVTRLGVVCE